MTSIPLQYLTDMKGNPVAVVLPIDFWKTIFPHDETDKILSSKKMKSRLIEAMRRDGGYTFEEVHEKLGI